MDTAQLYKRIREEAGRRDITIFTAQQLPPKHPTTSRPPPQPFVIIDYVGIIRK